MSPALDAMFMAIIFVAVSWALDHWVFHEGVQLGSLMVANLLGYYWGWDYATKHKLV